MLPDHGHPTISTGEGFALLDGVRVLDLTTSIAGPYGAMLLGDYGADVIKIERPGQGDDARQWGPPFLEGESLWFLAVNRNKRSVTLDFSKPEGRRVLGQLVAKSDVLITNQLPRVQAKLEIDYDSLRRDRADLVFVSLTGFGLSGDRRERPCYDLIAEGLSGVMDLTGEAANDPQKVGTAAADLLAGMDAAMATIAALFARTRTGQGRKVDISLVESMTRFMSPRLVSYLGSGELPRRTGAKDSVIAIYQTFHASDDPLTLGLGNDSIWKRFWKAVGRDAVGEEQRYASNAQRRDHRAEIVADIQEILKTKPRAHWLEVFAANGIPAGPINRIDEVAADPALIERGLFYRLERPGAPPAPQVNTGVQLDGAANRPRLAPPALGADTDEVLRSVAGLSAADIAALRAAGLV